MSTIMEKIATIESEVINHTRKIEFVNFLGYANQSMETPDSKR